MEEGYLSPVITTVVKSAPLCRIKVQFGFDTPNVLRVYIDEGTPNNEGYGMALYRNEQVDINVNEDGELIITSYTDDEADFYSLDNDGNLIYSHP